MLWELLGSFFNLGDFEYFLGKFEMLRYEKFYEIFKNL